MGTEFLDKESYERLLEEMLEEARKTYSEKVIDHWMNPRNVGRLEEPQGIGQATGTCGDTMEISLRIKDDRILDVKYLTEGCGTTSAVGSMTTELVKGRTVSEALRVDAEAIMDALEGLPDAQAHCADLATSALKEALKNYFAFKREPWKRGYKR